MAVAHSIKKSTALNLIGQKFGKLTVISRSKNNANNKTMWKCICDCGNESLVIGSALKNGHSTTCGCGQKNAMSKLGKTRFDDLSGKKYSRLLVLNRAEDSKDGKPRFLCICDCGNKKIIKSSNLRNGSTTSCGCYVREVSKNRWLKHGQSRTKEYIRAKALKRSKKLRSDSFSLLKIRIFDLIKKSLIKRGYRKESPYHKILGCDYDQFRNHIEKQFTKGMSWDRISEIHIDHIVPISSAINKEDIYRLNHHTNLRPMWAKDNIRKGSKREFLI